MKITVLVSDSLQDKARIIEGVVRYSVSKAILTMAIKLQAYIRKEKLSGRPLKRVTGDLSRSVNYKTVDNGMAAIVGANTPYAARHEYGFTGSETVKAHVRRTRQQMKSAKFNAIGLETRPSKAKAKGTGQTMVKSFTRKVNYPARSYMRTSLEEMRSEIVDAISASVRNAKV